MKEEKEYYSTAERVAIVNQIVLQGNAHLDAIRLDVEKVIEIECEECPYSAFLAGMTGEQFEGAAMILARLAQQFQEDEDGQFFEYFTSLALHALALKEEERRRDDAALGNPVLE